MKRRNKKNYEEISPGDWLYSNRNVTLFSEKEGELAVEGQLDPYTLFFLIAKEKQNNLIKLSVLHKNIYAMILFRGEDLEMFLEGNEVE